MEVDYRVAVRSGVRIPVPAGTEPIVLNGVEVLWDTNEDGHLSAVRFVVRRVKLPREDGTGVILSTSPELQEEVFRVAAYVANCILLQTGLEAFNPECVIHQSPEVAAETPEEEHELRTRGRRVTTSFQADAVIRGEFRPASYVAGFPDSAIPIASVADSRRTSSLFREYEQLWRVVEYWFTEEEQRSDGVTKFDRRVSEHACGHDDRYTADAIAKLRIIRNRCIHPKAFQGPLRPDELASMNEVTASLPLLKDLVQLLLAHPPQ